MKSQRSIVLVRNSTLKYKKCVRIVSAAKTVGVYHDKCYYSWRRCHLCDILREFWIFSPYYRAGRSYSLGHAKVESRLTLQNSSNQNLSKHITFWIVLYMRSSLAIRPVYDKKSKVMIGMDSLLPSMRSRKFLSCL